VALAETLITQPVGKAEVFHCLAAGLAMLALLPLLAALAILTLLFAPLLGRLPATGSTSRALLASSCGQAWAPEGVTARDAPPITSTSRNSMGSTCSSFMSILLQAKATQINVAGPPLIGARVQVHFVMHITSDTRQELVDLFLVSHIRNITDPRQRSG
jgi:hypothetical protein